VWVGVFGYLLYMHIRQHRIERDMKVLREEVLKHVK